MATVDEAFRWARRHAARHMTVCEEADLRWEETPITEMVMAHAARAEAVTVIPFTASAEARGGADWIWWWVDHRGTYGMLVQAKRVTVNRGRWRFGFDYRAAKAPGSQAEMLWSTAEMLGLLPVYALYLGTGDYRGWEPCSADHGQRRCYSCVKRTVSLSPQILSNPPGLTDATSTYERSVALEDLWAPSIADASHQPAALYGKLAPELQDFLTKRQDGTRAVTRNMIDTVLRARTGQFALVSTDVLSRSEGAHDQLGQVFNDLPIETDHSGKSYFEHMLSPLRHSPPKHVLRIMSGDFNAYDLASDIPGNVAGVVVVQTPQQGT